jgi:hypothetical protein
MEADDPMFGVYIISLSLSLYDNQENLETTLRRS